MLAAPTHDTPGAKMARAVSPSWGWCARCGFPWRFVNGHTVYWTFSHGCFPLCDGCWERLSPEERLPFYEGHVRQWHGEDDAQAMRVAILGLSAYAAIEASR